MVRHVLRTLATPIGENKEEGMCNCSAMLDCYHPLSSTGRLELLTKDCPWPLESDSSHLCNLNQNLHTITTSVITNQCLHIHPYLHTESNTVCILIYRGSAPIITDIAGSFDSVGRSVCV